MARFLNHEIKYWLWSAILPAALVVIGLAAAFKHSVPIGIILIGMGVAMGGFMQACSFMETSLNCRHRNMK